MSKLVKLLPTLLLACGPAALPATPSTPPATPPSDAARSPNVDEAVAQQPVSGVEQVRAALTASLREVALPSRGRRGHRIVTGPIASRVHVRLTDSDGRVMERQATGVPYGITARSAAGLFYGAGLTVGEDSPLGLGATQNAEPDESDAALYARLVAWHAPTERLPRPLPALATRFRSPALAAGTPSGPRQASRKGRS